MYLTCNIFLVWVYRTFPPVCPFKQKAKFSETYFQTENPPLFSALKSTRSRRFRRTDLDVSPFEEASKFSVKKFTLHVLPHRQESAQSSNLFNKIQLWIQKW